MLRLLFGRSGSGKTQNALEKANELAMTGRNVVLLVPEQFTFEMERLLVTRYGAKSGLKIEVLSFSRLCHRVFREYGGFARRYLSDGGRMVLMQLALSQVSDMLRVYGRQTANPAFVKTMVETVAEYKSCGITPEQFEAAAEKTQDDLLRQKLADLTVMTGAYNAMLTQEFADPLDDLTRLAGKLEGHPFFEGRCVIFDSFKGFTPQEKRVLVPILRQAEDVIVTLCADRVRIDGEADESLFSAVGKTAAQLIRLAHKAGVPIAKPVMLEGVRRFANPALRLLEEKIFRPGAQPCEEPAPQIHLFTAADVYAEAEFVARRVSNLVRGGARYRDIVVIARSLEPYTGIIEPIFEKYRIPYYFDCRRSVEFHPLMALVLSALEVIRGDFRYEPVFRYLKTGLAGFDITQISELENYVLTWDIRGGDKWRREWKDNPDGFSEEFTDEQKQALARVNALRARVVDAFEELRESLRDGMDGAGMASALYAFLERNRVPQAVQRAYDALLRDGEQELADEYRQIYGVLVGLFDQIAYTVKERPLSVQEFAGFVRLVIANADMGHIPPSLDEVTVGDAERIRAGEARYAFVIGLAEGVFPRAGTSGGLLSDAERKKLIGLGLELSPASEEKSAEERYIAYKAFTTASDGLFLSYPCSDARGKPLRPSYFFTGVGRLFPRCDLSAGEEDPLDAVQNEETAYELMAARYHDGDTLSRALRTYFAPLEGFREKLAALERAATRRPAAFEDKSAARALFGERMHLSPSRLETFEQCRFQYFCRYGLSALPLRKAELAAPEIGTVIHYVLEHLLSEYRGRGAWPSQPEALRQRIKELLQEFAQAFFGGLEDKPERFKHQYLRLESAVVELVEHISKELAQSEFEPADFELSIREDGEVVPLCIPLDDGGELTVGGKVDRVDLMKKDGETFLRVVDYKTGRKEFNLSDVLCGLNLQMLIYLFTLCDNAGERYGGALRPAGVLYVPAKRPNLLVERDDDPEKIREQAAGEYRMNGLLLNDDAVILGMERDGLGHYIKANSTLASFENLGRLRGRIREILTGMAAALRRGDVAALPVAGSGYTPCEYCDYASVCGHEAGDPCRQVPRLKSDEIWETLAKEDGHGRA